MSDSLRLAIVKDLVTTLAGIKTSAGYHTTIVTVQADPVVLETLLPGQIPACYVHADAPGDREYQPAMRVKDRYNFTIVIRADATGQAYDRKTSVFENLVADIEKALAVDITRGGNATDTRPGHPEAPLMQLGAGNMVIVVQPIVVLTRHVFGQP